MFVNYNDHVALMLPFDVYTPKTHIIWHMCHLCEFQGNPKIYSNWVDEDLNRTLKDTCRGLSQLSFEGPLLLRLREILQTKKRPPPM